MVVLMAVLMVMLMVMIRVTVLWDIITLHCRSRMAV